MKSVLFVVCFSLGVSLMIFSGYLPQAANARGNGDDLSGSGGLRGVGSLGDNFGGTVSRKALSELPPAPADSGSSPSGVEEFVEPEVAEEEFAEEPEPAFPVADAPAREFTDPDPDVQPQDWPEMGAPADQRPVPPPPVELPPVTVPALEPPASANPAQNDVLAVMADAGSDRVVWIGWDELVLDGSGSIGEGLSYQWQQTGGPLDLELKNPGRAVTSAVGMLTEERPGWRPSVYRFELIVTDARGVQSVDTVEYVAKRAPTLKVKPVAERRFEVRDGYLLGHYVSWTTNLETYETVFEITSELELTFSKVNGGTYDLTGGKADRGYVYQVVVYPQGDEISSWVEFLVNSDEKIPGIVQLGVNWETR